MTLLNPRPTPHASIPRSAPYPRVEPVAQIPILILSPHNRCNCRCLMCDIWKEKKPIEITAAHVSSWLAEWRGLGVKRVVLTGGEALMHSHLWKLCELLAEAEIGITLLSSGLLLARDAEKIARYVDDLVVSLDGPREVHDEIRNVPRAYERLAEGVRAVRSAGPQLLVTGRCTVQRKNSHLLRETVRDAKEAGLMRISFLPVDVSSEAFNRPGDGAAESAGSLALSRAECFELENELDRLEIEHAADFESGFIAESPQKLRRKLLGYFRALTLEGDFPLNECNAPWVSSVVEADGTVRPCFFQPALGNIHRSGSLAAVLNSEEAIAFRRGLDIATNLICRRCVCTLNLREPLAGKS